jgi:hypothetical protein
MRHQFMRTTAPDGYDASVQSLIDKRLAASDPLPTGYADAINNFVLDLKSVSGFWDDIIQLVVIAGATTVAGAVCSIKGNDLTSVSFVNSDIGLKTGAIGNGTSKYFQSGYSGNPAGTGQNDFHMYAYLTSASTGTGSQRIFANGGTAAGRRLLTQDSTAVNTQFRSNGAAAFSASGRNTGNHGISRGSSANFTSLIGTTYTTHTDTSVAASGGPYYILAAGPDTGSTPVTLSFSDARILIWALGAHVDLQNYSTPAADLVTALNAL